ncbi:hypothetical protein CALVIDRAFT_530663 [Calocera viscosa TUFC12733]|uniref:Uncharacterized protein n=1 Tax=Calocera viscosa (strain TUFC12733) TaxID=1330018 RepID=A0A167HKD5_CALVF|nr:hypothetical protein CALVIDRAFT_530663 [Calocera viscosa TUFC12733]
MAPRRPGIRASEAPSDTSKSRTARGRAERAERRATVAPPVKKPAPRKKAPKAAAATAVPDTPATNELIDDIFGEDQERLSDSDAPVTGAGKVTASKAASVKAASAAPAGDEDDAVGEKSPQGNIEGDGDDGGDDGDDDDDAEKDIGGGGVIAGKQSGADKSKAVPVEEPFEDDEEDDEGEGEDELDKADSRRHELTRLVPRKADDRKEWEKKPGPLKELRKGGADLARDFPAVLAKFDKAVVKYMKPGVQAIWAAANPGENFTVGPPKGVETMETGDDVRAKGKSAVVVDRSQSFESDSDDERAAQAEKARKAAESLRRKEQLDKLLLDRSAEKAKKAAEEKRAEIQKATAEKERLRAEKRKAEAEALRRAEAHLAALKAKAAETVIELSSDDGVAPSAKVVAKAAPKAHIGAPPKSGKKSPAAVPQEYLDDDDEPVVDKGKAAEVGKKTARAPFVAREPLNDVPCNQCHSRGRPCNGGVHYLMPPRPTPVDEDDDKDGKSSKKAGKKVVDMRTPDQKTGRICEQCRYDLDDEMVPAFITTSSKLAAPSDVLYVIQPTTYEAEATLIVADPPKNAKKRTAIEVHPNAEAGPSKKAKTSH